MAAPAEQDDLKSRLWRCAYDIFEDALERPAGERERFARERASDNPELIPIVLELIRNASDEDPDDSAFMEPAQRIGRRIGRYEITGKLGRGAMGHVYSARDLELGRVVALKFLIASTPGERLISEAKAASALNHPNIVTVFDVVREGQEIALAMELVEGRSLREFCRGLQPVEQVVRWGRQIAQALAATHERGIVHRDIKPENVMLRPDDLVKVLDFGLAKRATLPGGSRSTLFGVMAGTLNYMSPEQTRGESLSAATDVFSLGSVLYELVCGRHPFQSGSPIDTAYAIAHKDPARAATVRKEIPPALDALLMDMLAKGPARRPSAKEVEQRLAAVEAARPAMTRPKSRWRWIAAAVVVAAAGAGLWNLEGKLVRPAALTLVPVTRLSEKSVTAAAISPEGKHLVYALKGGPFYLRHMDDGATETLAAPADLRATRIAWFADGKRVLVSGSIGAQGPQTLYVLRVDGTAGEPVLIASKGRDGVPSPDGSKIAMKSADGDAIWVTDGGGAHAKVIRAAAGNATFHSLVWSPDSRRVSYMVLRQAVHLAASYTYTFETVDIESGAVLVQVDNVPMLSATALPDGRIFCIPWAYPAVSHGGELIEIRTDPKTGTFLGKSTRPIPLSTEGLFYSLTVSNDASMMVLVSASEFVNVYTADLVPSPNVSLTNLRRLTFDWAEEFPHAWTADGQSVIFESNRNGKFGLFRIGLDEKEAVPLFVSTDDAVHPEVTGDGKWILFHKGPARHQRVMMRIPVEGAKTGDVVDTAGKMDEEQRCGGIPGSRCVIRSREDDQFVVRELDPIKGRGQVLARTPYAPYLMYDWDLSPDGNTIAIPNHDSRSAQIRLTSLNAAAGSEDKVIRLEGLRNINAVSWTADGQGLFVMINTGSGGLMLYCDLAGHTTKLLESSKVTYVAPSRDGRHIAFPEHVLSSNVQMLK